MTSQITFTTINENFPVSGEDNDSQGFRDNFRIIKEALQTASTEIEILQDQTVKLDQNNDFNNSEIQNAVLSSTATKVNNAGTTVSSISIDYTEGQYQIITVSSGVSRAAISLGGWVDTQDCSTMRVEIKRTGPGPVEIVFNTTGALKLTTTWPTQLILNESALLVEFWTYDGGNTVYGRILGEFVDA